MQLDCTTMNGQGQSSIAKNYPPILQAVASGFIDSVVRTSRGEEAHSPLCIKSCEPAGSRPVENGWGVCNRKGNAMRFESAIEIRSNFVAPKFGLVYNIDILNLSRKESCHITTTSLV
jgi:hypothetical protein